MGKRRERAGAIGRGRLIALMGVEVARFQEESGAFDDVAARVLALGRDDLSCMTLLLFGGPASVAQLAASLHTTRLVTASRVARLQMAGYARRRPGGRPPVIELTEHARAWIARIWEPLGEDGARLLARHATRDLAVMHRFMVRARDVQERHRRRLQAWLEEPALRRGPHLRGGMTPAALGRVQIFVEANLDQPIRLRDLAARSGLSLHHFARAFRVSTGSTPRAFVEARRFERARQLIDEGQCPLAEIAVATGFGTQSRLTTVFKRHAGFTPGAYRRHRDSL